MKRGQKHPVDPTIEALKAAAGSEAVAVAFMESRRWNGKATCPYCAGQDVYAMLKRGTQERNKDFRWRCRKCSQMFTVRTGTVMEETRLPLRVWCFAFWQSAASKKGVSALQISRECQISYKSALFLMHRIRHVMANDPSSGPLKGQVEVDETYVGGKPRFRRSGARGHHDKVPVIGMVERGGRVRLQKFERVNIFEIGRIVRGNVSLDARLLTDEAPHYRSIGKVFKGGHESVSHKAGEYVRGAAHSNSIESVWAIVKRGMYGVFHSVSRDHLHRYLAEFQFRFNQRHVSDGDRTNAAIKAAVGRRLRYEDYVVRKAA